MKHQICNINEYKVNIDYSVESSLKSFKEEVLDHLYTSHKKHSDTALLFSGGMDSTFILRSLIELGVKPQTLTMSFSRNHDDYDCNRVKKLCADYGLSEPEFFYMEKDKVIDSIYQSIFKNNIAYPMLHGFYISYLLNEYDNNFYCGMGSEFKMQDGIITMPFGPQIIKQNHPDRLFNITSSRTFLSYVNHEHIVQTYQEKLPVIPDGRLDVWYARDLIYNSCYPDIAIEKKRGSNHNYIAEVYRVNILPIIQKKYPLLQLTRPFTFDVGNYLRQRKK